MQVVSVYSILNLPLHMRLTVNSHALPVYKKNRIASLLCIFETTVGEGQSQCVGYDAPFTIRLYFMACANFLQVRSK